MFNNFKSASFNYIFHAFMRGSYELAWETDIEETYFRENDVVVFVKNEEIGRQLYNLIKTMLQDGCDIIASDLAINFKKFYVSDENVVNAFCFTAELADDKQFKSFTRMKKLETTLEIIRQMNREGYTFVASKFNNKSCDNISTFFACFKTGVPEELVYEGCLVEYAHYALSDGSDLHEFYEEISKSPILDMYKFPYATPITRMCYEYYLNSTVPADMFDVLQAAKSDQLYMSYYGDVLFASSKDFGANYRVISDNVFYTIYEGNIKIYKNMSDDFTRFLVNSVKQPGRFSQFLDESVEKLIFDFNGNVIGQKFKTRDNNISKLVDMSFDDFVTLWEYLKSLKETIHYITETLPRIYNANMGFDIEKAFCISTGTFKVCNIEYLYLVVGRGLEYVSEQLVAVFFKHYKTTLVKQYGNLTEANDWYSKAEIKYMDPAIAKEFVKYLLGEFVNYKEIVDDFKNYLDTALWNSNRRYVYYDEFFSIPGDHLKGRAPFREKGTDPVEFYFDYEVEKEFGLSLKKGETYDLPDGRKVVVLKRSNNDSLEVLKARENDNLSEISRKIIGYSSSLNLVKFNKVIFSRNIWPDGNYQVIGYITDPIRGESVTDEYMLGLNNRDLLKTFATSISKVTSQDFYIPFELLRIDENYNCFVDLTSKDFRVCRRRLSKGQPILKCVAKHLIEEGYNPNAFVGIDKYLDAPDALWMLVQNMENYCEEHGIYFSMNDDICPVCSQTLYMVSSGFERTSRIVLEDMEAVHYALDEAHNVKIYKKPVGKRYEANEEDIISRCIVTEGYFKSKFQQDGFKPVKKAIDQNKHFIGYVYETCECVDLRDTKTMSNVHRVKSLMRLMMQVENILDAKKNFGFTKNPFSYVFLSKNYAKQVQILNIELLGEKQSQKNTIKWAMDYIMETLRLDPAIDTDGLDKVTEWKELYRWLEKWTRVNTKRCPIHRIYYNQEHLVCPLCVSTDLVKQIPITKMSEFSFDSKDWAKKPIGEGGESFIYACNSNTVAKKFKQDQIDKNFKTIVLAKIMSKSSELKRINQEGNGYEYVIPKTLIVDEITHEIFAYYMDRVNDAMPISNLRDKAIIQKNKLTQKDIFEILITVGKGIEALHELGIFIGDLNGRNILFNPNTKKVFFLDFDGMGVDEISPMFCTDDYIDPVSKKNCNITPADDWYSFAVQVFHYLTYTHPFNGIYNETVNGRKVLLSIPQKMERRVSLLGNHGMKPPAIAVSWDWMSQELVKDFLDIFEDTRRTSIVPDLIKQYEKLYGQEVPTTNQKRVVQVNEKFVAIELMEYGSEKIIRVINSKAAICRDSNGNEYLAILVKVSDDGSKKMYALKVECGGIFKVHLLPKNQVAWIVYRDRIVAYNWETMEEFYCENISNIKDSSIADGTLYIIRKTEDTDVILKRTYLYGKMVSHESLETFRKIIPNLNIQKFLAKSEKKFIMVVKESENTDAVYCNMEKFCTITCKSPSRRYNIVYDKFSKNWLVINNEGEGVIINESNGTSMKVSGESLGINFQNLDIDSIRFRKSVIYIPDNENLHLITVKDRFQSTKSMACHEIMKPSSRLYNINKDGFSVITPEDTFYEVRKS